MVMSSNVDLSGRTARSGVATEAKVVQRGRIACSMSGDTGHTHEILVE
jgi:hypothetical protein